MTNDSCTKKGDTMILACSGASNVGQLANRAALELAQEGLGNMSCLAGIGGKLAGFVKSAKEAPSLVVMDGCEVGCAKAIFQEAAVPLRGYLVLTELGIIKNKDFNLKEKELDQVKQAARKMADGQEREAIPQAGSCCSCS